MPEGIADFRHSGGVAGQDALSVCLVVGSPHGDGAVHCGVRDYAECLAKALNDAGIAARVMAPATWSARDGLAFLRRLRAERLDVAHLQYPSIGHRRSLLPHMLGLAGAARRFAVTLHEHSALPRPQRAANSLFRASADRLVFTTRFEADAFGAAPDSLVIPIGSNVPVHPGTLGRDGTVLHFGQIRPNKGVEAFVALARLAAEAGDPACFRIMGSTPPRWRGYAGMLRAQLPANLAWVEDAPSAEIGRAMASAFAAYLPFPDGAGLRRGSLLAALSNGLPVLAPFGPSTTESLRVALLQAESPGDALNQIGALRNDAALGRRHAAAGRDLVRPFGWAVIAAEHAALYRRMLAR